MAQCSFCSSETELYDDDVPVCLACLDAHEAKRKLPSSAESIRSTLLREITDATALTNAANESLYQIMKEIPSGLPSSDGVQRLYNASKELSLARKRLMTAHRRLNEFVSGGTLSEDLKRSG